MVGVASSPILIGNSKMYRGCIGGIQDTGWNIYAKIKCTPFVANQNTCGTTFGGYGLSATARIRNCVVYDLPLQVRATSKSAQTNAGYMYRWIFGKVDFILEQSSFKKLASCGPSSFRHPHERPSPQCFTNSSTKAPV